MSLYLTSNFGKTKMCHLNLSSNSIITKGVCEFGPYKEICVNFLWCMPTLQPNSGGYWWVWLNNWLIYRDFCMSCERAICCCQMKRWKSFIHTFKHFKFGDEDNIEGGRMKLNLDGTHCNKKVQCILTAVSDSEWHCTTEVLRGNWCTNSSRVSFAWAWS